MKLPKGKTRLDLVKEMVQSGKLSGDLPKQGRFVVAIDRLVEDPKNERKTFRNMKGLIASIKAVGIVDPPNVIPLDDGRYQIVTGHRRFRAAKAAGLKTIEVLVREAEDQATLRRKSIVSNVQREDVNPIEMAEALQSLLDDKEIASQRELAHVIGKDETWVSRMLRILDLPPKLQAKLATSQVSLSYDAVANIARVASPSVQKQLVADLLGGAGAREIRHSVRQVRGGGSRPAEPKPKEVYTTTHKATVIVQSSTSNLTRDRIVAALKEAIRKARAA
jgi:ParB/RepB/Spo0J family partition protein